MAKIMCIYLYRIARANECLTHIGWFQLIISGSKGKSMVASDVFWTGNMVQ